MKTIFTGMLLCVALCFSGLSNTACATNNAPQVVTTVSTAGTELMGGIKKFQQAVFDAEAAGKISRNKARTAVEATKTVGDAGQTAAKLLQEYLNARTLAEKQSLAQQIQAALGLVNSGLVQALLPIDDEATRTSLTAFITEIQKTVLNISSQLLAGGVK
jgi:hypothetical protein